VGSHFDVDQTPRRPRLATCGAELHEQFLAIEVHNSRALVPEALVRADEWALVRPRVTAAELIALDRLPAWLSDYTGRYEPAFRQTRDDLAVIGSSA
jgi:hypothetical protein